MLRNYSTKKSVVQKVGVPCYISDSTVSRPHYLPHSFMSASANCCLASEPNALPTVRCCHIALRTVTVQHSNYSSDMHTAEHLPHTNTFTVTTGADIDRRPTGDLQHSNQFPVLTTVPQFGCTGTDSLLHRAQFTVRYSQQEKLHTSAGIHVLNKETLKKQPETGEAEVQLHSSFNKRTGFSQNCNSEHGKLAELLPNSDNM